MSANYNTIIPFDQSKFCYTDRQLRKWYEHKLKEYGSKSVRSFIFVHGFKNKQASAQTWLHLTE